MLNFLLEKIPKYIESEKNTLYLSISHLGKLPFWSVNYKDAAGNKFLDESIKGESLEEAIIGMFEALLTKKDTHV